MKIACLQFNSQIGKVAANFSRAESLLMREEHEGLLDDIDLLVLPELAFTGYNHPSLAAIAPYLEPTADGPSTRWAVRTAKRLGCTVAVGYPEAAEGGYYGTLYDSKITAAEGAVAYNSLVFVNYLGDVVAHYRKSFLYYTDDNWAKEGNGFYAGVLPIGPEGKRFKVAAGICMDINPYKFESPWTAYEFANHAREARAKVVVISMAWLTRLTEDEISANMTSPDMDTLGYWIERFRPLLGANGPEDEVILVCANRTGFEGLSERIGAVRYAGSSTVMGLRKADADGSTQVRIWDVMGRDQDGVLLVDTLAQPKYSVRRKPPESDTVAVAGDMSKRPVVETKVQAS